MRLGPASETVAAPSIQRPLEEVSPAASNPLRRSFAPASRAVKGSRPKRAFIVIVAGVDGREEIGGVLQVAVTLLLARRIFREIEEGQMMDLKTSRRRHKLGLAGNDVVPAAGAPYPGNMLFAETAPIAGIV